MRARDLFAGSGWSVACRTLGIEDHGVEWDEHARETRRINGLITVGSDVRDVNGADGEYVLEIGSPPCERFTQTGHGDGSKARREIIEAVDGMEEPGDIYDVIKSLDAHHEKIGLVLEPFRVLLENPHARAVIWEQVITVLPIWEAVARKLRRWGWSVDTRNVNASWYGVPQDRKRAILMARRDGEAKIPGQVENRVMRDVFPDRDGWLQRSNYSAPATAERRTAQERGRTMRTLDQVSVTMTRKAAQWVHPDGSVTKMTVADMAAVQTFPEGMVFAGGVGDQRLQIGNAVPPRMAEILIRAALGLTLNSHAGKVGLNSKDDGGEADMTSTDTQTTEATEAERAAKIDHTGSTIVALIERVWDRIRAGHPELPAVVVTTGSGEFVKWGHFRPNSWKTVDGEKRHEFFLASEALAKGAHQVLQTTIHEAAHTLSNVRGVKDTSRQHRYHNGTFRKTAEELGLEHKASTPDKTHGFSFVTLTEATKVKYADLLAELDKELTLTGLLPFWLGGDSDEDEKGGEKITKPKGGGTEEGEEPKSQSGNLKATCQCEEPKIIRLSRKVLDLGVVQCTDCEALFTA